MRLRNITGSREIIAQSKFVVRKPEKCRGNWSAVFGNTNPIHIEIGMGKGRFLTDMATLHPEINYIGIEKYSSVLLRAVQKMEERAEPLYNVRFIRMDAEAITGVFGEGEADRIYLNFSDPWPKDRHAKRRLPSGEFLARYDSILRPDGSLEFKTDNRDLFAFAVSELAPAGWKAEKITWDLHHEQEMMRGNVMTEYEEKFSAAGNPICKYIIVRRNTGSGKDAEAIPEDKRISKKEGTVNKAAGKRCIIMEYKFTTANFDKEVLQSELPVLVDFFAQWCGPCKMMAPIVEGLAEEFDGKIKIGKCDIDEEMDIAQRYSVMSIPTFIIFQNGEAVDTTVGAMSKDALENKLKSLLA